MRAVFSGLNVTKRESAAHRKCFFCFGENKEKYQSALYCMLGGANWSDLIGSWAQFSPGGAW